MDNKTLYKYVDHTLLNPYAKWENIIQICEESIKYNTVSVCIPPSYVKGVHEQYGDKINICTVIGFPLGYSVIQAKAAETRQALLDGANEIDMVINISDLKNEDYKKIEHEIKELKSITGDKILKVIIETCYLTKEEIIKMCQIVTAAKADYIKTSTGFGTGGATLENVLIMKENIGPNVKIKAAGGIKTKKDMQDYIKAGCSRLGTSSAVKILEAKENDK